MRIMTFSEMLTIVMPFCKSLFLLHKRPCSPHLPQIHRCSAISLLVSRHTSMFFLASSSVPANSKCFICPLTELFCQVSFTTAYSMVRGWEACPRRDPSLQVDLITSFQHVQEDEQEEGVRPFAAVRNRSMRDNGHKLKNESYRLGIRNKNFTLWTVKQ